MLRFLLAVAALALAMPANAQPTMAWSRADAEQLLEVVGAIGGEGLDPRDYDQAAIGAALAGGRDAQWSERASATFLRLAADLGSGHVTGADRIGWRLAGSDQGSDARQGLMALALAEHRVGQVLLSLAPRNEHYLALKARLAATPRRDKAAIALLRANLERWRWMPRDLGPDYVMVNVPAFELVRIEDGRVGDRRPVIVGKPATPTPQLAAAVTGVTINPWWDVPPSIIAESVGAQVRNNPRAAAAKGYVASWRDGRLQVRQRPGPTNALGQMKLVMPNPFRVYLHDTPTKALFAEERRAFSHGCIRVGDALGFASLLLSAAGWDRARFDAALAGGSTTTVPLPRAVPIYVTYFTAAVDGDGAVATYPDIYGRDAPVVAKLVDREPVEPRS